MSVLARFRDRAAPFRDVLAFSFSHWRRQRARVVLITIGVLLMTLADVLLPVYVGRLIDALAPAVQPGEAADRAASLREAFWALAAMIALGLLMLVTRHLAFIGVCRLTLVQMVDVAREAFWKVQRFAAEWHANTFAGSIVRKVTRGMWAIDLLNDTVLLALLPSFVVLVGSTALLGWHWPLMGLAVTVGALVFIGMTASLSIGYIGPAARLSNQWDTRTGGALADAVTCNPVVKSFGAEHREDARLLGVLGKWKKRTYRTWMRHTNSSSGQILALIILRTAVIGLALYLWWVGEATAGEVAYVMTAYVVIQGYLRDVGMYIRDLQKSVNDMEELVEIHAQPLGIEDRIGAEPIVIRQGRIAFEDVRFHYRGHHQPLYDGLSVAIGAGEKIGLVGLSGSGKTTFVKLIQRLHDVDGGRILIDGHDISQVTQASLRAQIAIVQQEPILFHRSLSENIAYAKPGATQAEMERAAKLANAHDFIAKLPKGYGTLVGERGIKLSGGERQRVALARAFLADAPILVLDEATSSLDSESEALIQEATERLMQGRTTIVIAHRLSTVRALKRILIFDRGRIIEEGDHGALIQREKGVYRRLFDRQVGGLLVEAG
ncbi:ABC transporter ATP-binding protein [Dongia deserti]|uniref:ABC transporter ATP-binding protein n=1 Tax=Dongia deserti TaxID=2268030 RepID=UPI000E651F78|nr:ABC transporter ATP-binding protein [Dongia deserti]